MAFHNLTEKPVEASIKSLLGLSLKFCPAPSVSTSADTLRTFSLERLSRNVRVKTWFENQPFDDDEEFNRSMYVPSDWEPPTTPAIINDRLDLFEDFVCQKYTEPRRHSKGNLRPGQLLALKDLRARDDLLVVQCDKNLGPALIRKTDYIKFAVRDHLSDSNAYERVTPALKAAVINNMKADLTYWLKTHKAVLSKQEKKFIRVGLQQFENLPLLYLTMKVHKTPLKTRPIVSCSGTIFAQLGKWVDQQLQPIAQAQPSYIKSSFDFRDELLKLDIPPGALLFTADAQSMYTNIPTADGLRLIREYLYSPHCAEFDFDIDAVMSGLSLIMNQSYFDFGDTTWKQTRGTTMGTPPAPPYATLYYAIHERALMSDFSDSLNFYRRYLDDVFGIWIPSGLPSDAHRWRQFKEKMNDWPGLIWDCTPLSTSVDFLDMTISFKNDKLVTTLFEKELNLYLYLPPSSAHAPGVITGLVFGNIRRIYLLCSAQQDRENKVHLFYQRLIARGWSRQTLRPLFIRAISNAITLLQRRSNTTVQPANASLNRDSLSTDEEDNRILFHLRYNPLDKPSKLLQHCWSHCFLNPLDDIPINEKVVSVRGRIKRFNFGRLLICHHRQPNLGNLLSYRRLKPGGFPASLFLNYDFSNSLQHITPRDT